MRCAIDKAREYGIGLVAVRNSNHFGIASFYSMMATRENMIGFALTNASPAMNPYGTISPLLGTNPIALAVPTEKETPIVLDMSTSMVARGKIRFAALTGNSIPLGWATDCNGIPTTDANEAIKGSLEPIGGVKGSGLSLMVDIFCGILSNSCLTGEVKTIVDTSGPAQTGHLLGAVNIANYIPAGLFKQNIDAVIAHIKSLPSKGQEVFLPGEREFNLAAEREKEGIPLEKAVIDDLNRLADRYNIERL
jgi:LDH2 family malate/lactate/ureidoglycolate dehydrogenase